LFKFRTLLLPYWLDIVPSLSRNWGICWMNRLNKGPLLNRLCNLLTLGSNKLIMTNRIIITIINNIKVITIITIIHNNNNNNNNYRCINLNLRFITLKPIIITRLLNQFNNINSLLLLNNNINRFIINLNRYINNL